MAFFSQENVLFHLSSVSTYNSPVSCFWDRNEYCYIDCMSGPSSSLSAELETLWNQVC